MVGDVLGGESLHSRFRRSEALRHLSPIGPNGDLSAMSQEFKASRRFAVLAEGI